VLVGRVEQHGVAGLSVGALANAMEMRPQSLYHYFRSKEAIYDRMYREGFEELLERVAGIDASDEAAKVLTALAEAFVDFAGELPSRYQLLFQRTVPGFEPSAESFEVSKRTLDEMRMRVRRVGITAERDIDLWRALLVGLAGEQLANDPGGRRWRQLARDAAGYFASYADHRKAGRT
jgi:AcrR family transcriptional regulator